ncbi:MAG: histidine kinase, partial [Bacteroidia bacterium]|nr:histidine kinase [Bacteroidia bacterium]
MNWTDFKGTYQDLLKSKGFLHFSFWVLLYFFLVLIDQSKYPLWYVLIKELVDVSFYILIVYANIFYLIPQFLQKKKFIHYFLAFVLLVALVSPIKTLSYFLLYQSEPNLQAIVVDNQTTIFMICLFVGMASTIFQVTTDWLAHQNVKRELESQRLHSELKFLKSQINPHFFFNTLNNLYALTLKKSDLAPEIVLRLSEMMRYMLYESNEKKVPLEKEIAYIKNYLELEKLRQGDKFDIKLNLEGNLNGQEIAPLIFIPFLENSFKHGLDNQIKSGYVKIDLQLSDESLHMEIENSKPPTVISLEKNLKRSG